MKRGLKMSENAIKSYMQAPLSYPESLTGGAQAHIIRVLKQLYPDDTLEELIELLYLTGESGKKFSLLPYIKYKYGVNLPYIVTRYHEATGQDPDNQILKTRSYHKVTYRLKTLESKGFISIKKSYDGLLYCYPTNNLIYLIQGLQNSRVMEAPLKPDLPKILQFPQNARKERHLAAQLLARTPAHMPPERAEELGEFFDDYIQDILNRFCLMSNEEDPSQIIQMPYKTRFTTDDRKVRNLKIFDSIWKQAGKKYSNAVFLTLTTAPGDKTNWTANRKFAPAWNSFMTKLSSKMGFRPKYICIYEFTRFETKKGQQPKKGGLLHCHVVFFGISYLMKANQLSTLWASTGQGKIIDIKEIRKNYQTNEYEWGRNKPKDARNENPIEYTKKYLKKVLFADVEAGGRDCWQFALFWAVNKRFFSYSRIFKPDEDLDDWKAESGINWIFIGSAYVDEITKAISEYSEKIYNKSPKRRLLPPDTGTFSGRVSL